MFNDKDVNVMNDISRLKEVEDFPKLRKELKRCIIENLTVLGFWLCFVIITFLIPQPYNWLAAIFSICYFFFSIIKIVKLTLWAFNGLQ